MGELVTLWTARVAMLSSWLAALCAVAGRRGRERTERSARPSTVGEHDAAAGRLAPQGAAMRCTFAPLARWWWTVALAVYLLHVVSALHFYHRWSHAAALHHTAQRTYEVVGWWWSGGLYINYAFTLLWIGDVLWWWLAPQHFVRRPAWLARTWHGVFVFMAVNGAIVFAVGGFRWVSLGALLVLMVAWAVMRPSRGDAPLLPRGTERAEPPDPGPPPEPAAAR
jgi:hypothetical protein